MAKKFKSGISKILGDNKIKEPVIKNSTVATTKKVGRPKDPTKRTPTKSSQEGTKNDETRATFIVNEQLLEKLKNIAYWDRKKIKEVVGIALSEFVDEWEEEHGAVKQRPL